MKHESRTTCCTHKFSANDIQGRLMNQMDAFGYEENNLYGGNAERFAHATCPECKTKYVMWLKRQSPSFRVLTISKVDELEGVQMTFDEDDNAGEVQPETVKTEPPKEPKKPHHKYPNKRKPA